MGQGVEESVEENNTEESIEEADIRPPRAPYVDFSYIEENHEILEYDICAEPQYDWENTPLEDYLVCMDGVRYSGSGGNVVEIYVQEDDGSLRYIFHVHDRLHFSDGSHARFTVLNEKTDGYYAIVLTSNRILRYDKDTDRYEFHDGE